MQSCWVTTAFIWLRNQPLTLTAKPVAGEVFNCIRAKLPGKKFIFVVGVGLGRVSFNAEEKDSSCRGRDTRNLFFRQRSKKEVWRQVTRPRLVHFLFQSETTIHKRPIDLSNVGSTKIALPCARSSTGISKIWVLGCVNSAARTQDNATKCLPFVIMPVTF